MKTNMELMRKKYAAVTGEREKPYREGTLLRDCGGRLWMITGHTGHSIGPSTGYYAFMRLKDSLIFKTEQRIVHLEYDLVSET